MSGEKRWSVKLADVKTILLRCKCGAISGFPPEEWTNVPYNCQNCNEPRLREESPEYKALESFRISVKNVLRTSSAFELRFEFNGDD
jgi:hypothetical protein